MTKLFCDACGKDLDNIKFFACTVTSIVPDSDMEDRYDWQMDLCSTCFDAQKFKGIFETMFKQNNS